MAITQAMFGWRTRLALALALGALLVVAAAPGRAQAECDPFADVCESPSGGTTVTTIRPTVAEGTIVGPFISVRNQSVLVTITGPTIFPTDPTLPPNPILPPNPVIVLLPR